MRAGQLRQRVTIQEKIVTRDAYGEEDFTWGNVATVWASVEPRQGSKYLQATSEQVTYDTLVRMRYGQEISPENRMAWKGFAYNITSVITIDERAKELEVQCMRIHT